MSKQDPLTQLSGPHLHCGAVQMADPRTLKPHSLNDELFDPPDPEIRESMKEDIRENGVLYPILVTPDRRILDGHVRRELLLEIAKDDGCEPHEAPTQEVRGLDTEEKVEEFLIARNHQRRKRQKSSEIRCAGRLAKIYKRPRGRRKKNADSALFSGTTAELVGQKLGFSERTAALYITASKAPKEVLKAIDLKLVSLPEAVSATKLDGERSGLLLELLAQDPTREQVLSFFECLPSTNGDDPETKGGEDENDDVPDSDNKGEGDEDDSDSLAGDGGTEGADELGDDEFAEDENGDSGEDPSDDDGLEDEDEEEREGVPKEPSDDEPDNPEEANTEDDEDDDDAIGWDGRGGDGNGKADEKGYNDGDKGTKDGEGDYVSVDDSGDIEGGKAPVGGKAPESDGEDASSELGVEEHRHPEKPHSENEHTPSLEEIERARQILIAAARDSRFSDTSARIAQDVLDNYVKNHSYPQYALAQHVGPLLREHNTVLSVRAMSCEQMSEFVAYILDMDSGTDYALFLPSLETIARDQFYLLAEQLLCVERDECAALEQFKDVALCGDEWPWAWATLKVVADQKALELGFVDVFGHHPSKWSIHRVVDWVQVREGRLADEMSKIMDSLEGDKRKLKDNFLSQTASQFGVDLTGLQSKKEKAARIVEVIRSHYQPLTTPENRSNSGGGTTLSAAPQKAQTESSKEEAEAQPDRYIPQYIPHQDEIDNIFEVVGLEVEYDDGAMLPRNWDEAIRVARKWGVDPAKYDGNWDDFVSELKVSKPGFTELADEVLAKKEDE